MSNPSAIERLDEDILRSVFELFVSGAPNNNAMKLAQVCQYWRTLALSMGSLWGTIAVHENYISDMKRLEHYLPLSRQSPLDICIVIGNFDEGHSDLDIMDEDEDEGTTRDDDFDEGMEGDGDGDGYIGRFNSDEDQAAVVGAALNRLMPEVHRWRAFEFRTTEETLLQMVVDCLTGVTPFPGLDISAPRLRLFSLELADRVDHSEHRFHYNPTLLSPLFRGVTPALRELTLERVDIPLTEPIFHNLSSLIVLVTLPLDAPLPVFHTSLRLTYLSLTSETLAQQASFQHDISQAPRLTLEIIQDGNKSWGLDLFTPRSLVCVVKLIVRVADFEQDTPRQCILSRFYAILPLLPSLQVLKVDVLKHDQRPLQPQTRRFSLLSLRVLDVGFVSCRADLYSILDVIHAPALEDLIIKFDDEEQHVVDGQIRPLIDFINICQPPLKHLTYSSVNESVQDLQLLFNLLPPTIESLRLFRASNPIVLQILASVPTTGLLPKLRLLDLETCDVQWQDIQETLCARCGFRTPHEALPGLLDFEAMTVWNTDMGLKWTRLRRLRLIKGTNITNEAEEFAKTALGRFVSVELRQATLF